MLAAAVQTHPARRRLCVSVTECELVLTGSGPVLVTDLQTVAPRSTVSASSFPEALALNLATPRPALTFAANKLKCKL